MELAEGVYQYQPNERNDWILLNWLNRMNHDGELNHTLSEGVHNASAFLLFFRTRPLFVKVDDFENVTHAVWLEFSMGSVFLSFYVHPAHRRFQKRTLSFLLDIIDKLFEEGVNCIAGVIQERATPELTDKFIRQHERLGYHYSGCIPEFFDGKNAHIVSMTKAQWEQHNGRGKRQWRAEKQGRETGHRTAARPTRRVSRRHDQPDAVTVPAADHARTRWESIVDAAVNGRDQQGRPGRHVQLR